MTLLWSFCTFLLGSCWWVLAEGMLQGQRINSVAYPWMAGLLKESTWLARCSGAIIHPHFVITASLCLLKPKTMDEINKDKYVVVIPSRVNQVRRIDILIFPNRSISDFQTAGLIGVKKHFSLQPETAAKLSVWSWNKDTLTKQFDYIFQHAGFFTCTVVTWRDEPPKNPIRSLYMEEPEHDNSYKVKAVSAADVQLLHPDECKPKLCSDVFQPDECEVLLNRFMCVKVLDPENAYLCGADEGAALVCNDFAWGVLVGEIDCKTRTSTGAQYPVFFRMDWAVDLLNEHKGHYPPDPPDVSIRLLPRPMLFLSAQYIVFLLKFYRFIQFPSVNVLLLSILGLTVFMNMNE